MTKNKVKTGTSVHKVNLLTFFSLLQNYGVKSNFVTPLFPSSYPCFPLHFLTEIVHLESHLGGKRQDVRLSISVFLLFTSFSFLICHFGFFVDGCLAPTNIFTLSRPHIWLIFIGKRAHSWNILSPGNDGPNFNNKKIFISVLVRSPIEMLYDFDDHNLFITPKVYRRHISTCTWTFSDSLFSDCYGWRLEAHDGERK